jgi:hypothetical protein
VRAAKLSQCVRKPMKVKSSHTILKVVKNKDCEQRRAHLVGLYDGLGCAYDGEVGE